MAPHCSVDYSVNGQSSSRTLQGSKVDLQGARSTSSSLGDSPAMRLGVGVHPMGPARSVDLAPRSEYRVLASLDLGWLAAARCLPKACTPLSGQEGGLHIARLACNALHHSSNRSANGSICQGLCLMLHAFPPGFMIKWTCSLSGAGNSSCSR